MKQKKRFSRKLLSFTLLLAMIFTMMPMTALATDSLSIDTIEKVENSALESAPKPVMRAAGGLSEVYCDPYNASSLLGNDGSTASKPVGSLQAAVNAVAQNGTIYMMSPEKFRYTQTNTAIDGKGATVKPYSSYDSLLLHMEGACEGKEFTFTNITFDGSDYGTLGSYCNMIQVDYGTLNLNAGTVIENFDVSHGAALAIFGGTVNINDAIIQNNSCSSTSNSVLGGVFLSSGTLNFSSGKIANNFLSDGSTPLDIGMTEDGTFKMSGAAELGTISFAKESDAALARVKLTTALIKGFTVCRYGYFGIMELNNNRIVAEGTGGYALTAEDVKLISTPANSTKYVVFKSDSGQAIIKSKPYVIKKDPALQNGDIILDQTEAWPGDTITFSAVPASGFKIDISKIKITAGLYTVAYASGPVNGKYTFTMPGLSAGEKIVIKATFDPLLQQTLTGTAIYKLEYGVDSDFVLDMANTTVFGSGDTPPNPLVSFILSGSAISDGIVSINNGKVTLADLGVTTVTAIAAQTASHRQQTQEIGIEVKKPMSVALSVVKYDDDGQGNNDGITIKPSYIEGLHGINADTRALAYRKSGTNGPWTTIAPNDWSFNNDRTISFAGLSPNAIYEIRLSVDDYRSPSPRKATTMLNFTTPKEQSTNTGGIAGTVTGSGIITVTIERGNTVIAAATGLSTGDPFSFTNLPDGEYNLVASDSSNNKVTVKATVLDGKTTTLNVEVVGSTQSVVKVEEGAAEIAADGLKDLFDENIYINDAVAPGVVAGGGTVEMRLTADKAMKNQEINAIKAQATNKAMGVLIDLKVDMIIMPKDKLETVKPVTDTGILLQIAIPLPAEVLGKSGYKMYRYHNNNVDELPLLSTVSTPQLTEGFYINGGYAYVYAQKFSTYAIAFDAPIVPSGGSSNSSRKNSVSGSGIVSPPALNKADHFAYMVGDHAGNFRPNANISRAEVATVFYNLLADKSVAVSDKAFTDVPDSAWYKKAVNTLAALKVVNGYEDGTFRPTSPVTRAEFAAIASRFDTLSSGTKSFSDVSSGHWAYADINSAAAKGWVDGYPDGTFRPNQKITRAEVTVVVNGVLGRIPDKGHIDSKNNLRKFPDLSRTHWAFYNIAEAVNSHDYIKTGDGTETWTVE